MQIDITHEEAERIVVTTLLETLKNNIGDRDNLKDRNDLPDYEKENLRDYKKIIKDIVRVLRYFTTQDEFEENVAPLVPNHKKFLKERFWDAPVYRYHVPAHIVKYATEAESQEVALKR